MSPLHRFEHEFRDTYAIIGLAFLFSGLVDALVEDFTVKFFIILGIWLALWWFSLYEMIWYPLPDNPELEATVLLVGIICGVFGIHSLVWLLVSIMLGRTIGEWIWLAPGYYMPKAIFVPLAVALTVLYLVIGYIVNRYATDRRLE